MTETRFRFIESVLGENNMCTVTYTETHDRLIEAFRACFRKIDLKIDLYCTMTYNGVNDCLKSGDNLIPVTHNNKDEQLNVCWIQVIQVGDDQVKIPPLNFSAACCVLTPKG